MIISFRNKGLNSWAREFVANNHEVLGSETITRVLIGGGHEFKRRPFIKPGPIKRVIGKFPKGAEQPFSLHHYIFPNYSLCREEIQTSVCKPDNHPCFDGETTEHKIETYFLCLVDERGRRVTSSMWTEDEIEEALA